MSWPRLIAPCVLVSIVLSAMTLSCRDNSPTSPSSRITPPGNSTPPSTELRSTGPISWAGSTIRPSMPGPKLWLQTPSSPTTRSVAGNVPARRSVAPDTWLDKRPIGIVQFADNSLRTLKNPDGWFPPVFADPDKYFNAALEFAILHNYQGLLLYDVEGHHFRQPVTYVGKPVTGLSTSIPKTKVKMWVLRAAARGLWVGFTFRQTAFHPSGAQVVTTTPGDTVANEFLAARDYYGSNVKAIYWDTNINDAWYFNGGASVALLSDWVQRVRDMVGPNVLVMTEFTGVNYENIPGVAPIRFFNGTALGADTPSPVEILVPPTTPITPELRASYVAAMRAGGIMWATATWDAEDTKWIPDAYNEAHAP